MAPVSFLIAMALPAGAADVVPSAPDARFALALWCDPTCPDTVFDTLDAALARIPAREGLPLAPKRPVRVMGMAGPELGVPDAAFQETYGVGVDRPERLAASQQAILAWFASPPDKAVETLAAAHAAFARAAETTNGWVEDLDTQRVYGLPAWRALDPRGKLDAWFVVDAGPGEGGATRLVTRGLRRFGWADLVSEAVADDVAPEQAAVLTELAAEQGRRRAVLPRVVRLSSDTVRGEATLSEGVAREGDPEGPLVAVVFAGEVVLQQVTQEPPAPATAEGVPSTDATSQPGGVAEGPQPSAPTPASLPSTESPPLRDTPPTTLAEAQARAREALRGPVRAAFVKGLPSRERLLVKAPFEAGHGGIEYMWVEVRLWDDDTLTGVLANAPWDVPSRKKGDTVTVSMRKVFDYLWKRADGSREGNTTAPFVE